MWYQWNWNEARSRWEQSCAAMGCWVWRWADAIKVIGSPVLWIPGKDHDHEWGKWFSIGDEYATNNLFCGRRCACGAEERSESIHGDGVRTYFLADVAGRLIDKVPE